MAYPLYELPAQTILTKRKVRDFRSVLEHPFPIRVGQFESREEAERGIEREAEDRGFNAVQDLAIRHRNYRGGHFYTAVGTPVLVVRDSETDDKTQSEASEVNVRARLTSSPT